MSYKLSTQEMNQVFAKLMEKYDVYAPKRLKMKVHIPTQTLLNMPKSLPLMKQNGMKNLTTL